MATRVAVRPDRAGQPLKPWDAFDGRILPFLSLEQVYEDLESLRRDGRSWQAACPVHRDEPGGFSIDPERLEWNCFLGCGGGGPVQYLQKFRGLRWLDAALELALDAGLDADVLDPWCRSWKARDYEVHARLEARSSLLRLVGFFARSVLWSEAGQTLRSCLIKQLGFPEAALSSLELGLYTAPEDLWHQLKKSGRGEEARSWGLFESKWAGRVVCPWKDAQGRVLNLWGWLPREKPAGRTRRDGCFLFPDRDPLGSLAVPFNLDAAGRRGATRLLLLDHPLKALFLRAIGLEDPFPVASGGEVENPQVTALERYLERDGSLTLCFDYHPASHGTNRDRTARAVRRFRKTRIPLYVVDLAWAAGGSEKERWGVEDLIRREGGPDPGLAALRRLLERREAENVLEADLAEPEERAMPGVFDLFRGFASSRDGGRGEALEPLFHLAEEVGRRLAAGFLKAVPSRLLGSGGEEAEGGLELSARGAALPALEAAPPEAFSVARMEELSRVSPGDRTSPWAPLNQLGIRFSPGEFTVVAARTGHGKTAFLLGLLEHWLNQGGEGHFLFCSREEPEVRIYQRLLSLLTADQGEGLSVTEVAGLLRLGSEADGRPEARVLAGCREKLQRWESRWQVVYQPQWQVSDLAAYARTLFEGRLPGAILVDHLRVAGGDSGDGLGRLSHGLKLLSVELACPLIATVQIEETAVAGDPVPPGRTADRRVEEALLRRRPRLEYLREGGVEQEADLVLGLMNVAADAELTTEPADGTAFQVGALKNRYGPAGRWIELQFEGRSGRLSATRTEPTSPARRRCRPGSRKRQAVPDQPRERGLFDSSSP